MNNSENSKNSNKATNGFSEASQTTTKTSKAESRADRMARLKKQNWFLWFFKEWILTLGIAVLIAFFFRTTLAAPRHIPTGSMIPTIKIGEFIFVNMLAYNIHIPFTKKILKRLAEPERGEIVVFEFPKDPSKDYIKRVIGVPGDVVEVRNKRVFVNGEALPLEPVEDKELLADLTPKYRPDRMNLYRESNGDRSYFVAHINSDFVSDQSLNFGPETVPPDSFFVMGDNRDDSQDSRFWRWVPREKLMGRGSFIWFSVNLDHPPWVRFSRLMTVLE